MNKSEKGHTILVTLHRPERYVPRPTACPAWTHNLDQSILDKRPILHDRDGKQ